MDHQKTSLIAHPAYLYLGNEYKAVDHVISKLQSLFCATEPDEKKQACAVCVSCRKIRENVHESIIWLSPEKQYTVDDLTIIFSTISYALEDTKDFFFVIQKADTLSASCGNALLKSLEEPPRGYHFILLAQRAEMVLPTILSRCLIEQVGYDQEQTNHPLLSYFTTTAFQDPAAFSKELDTSGITEWETISLIDHLFLHWSTRYKNALTTNDTALVSRISAILDHLKHAIARPPMPGSSKMFWKNLFLQIKKI